LSELLCIASILYAKRHIQSRKWSSGGGYSSIIQPTCEWTVYVKISYTGKGQSSEALKVTVKNVGGQFEVLLPKDVAVNPIRVPQFNWLNESPLASATIESDSGTEEVIVQYLDRLPLGFRLCHHGTKVCQS
jgi:hypothetical protein